MKKLFTLYKFQAKFKGIIGIRPFSIHPKFNKFLNLLNLLLHFRFYFSNKYFLKKFKKNLSTIEINKVYPVQELKLKKLLKNLRKT